MLSVQLHQTERKDTCQCRSNTSNEIENGESLLDVIFEELVLCSHLDRSLLAISLTSSIPAVTSFQHTQKHTRSNQRTPVLDESHSLYQSINQSLGVEKPESPYNHDTRPAYNNRAQEICWANLSNDNRHWRLEDDVGYEEH